MSACRRFYLCLDFPEGPPGPLVPRALPGTTTLYGCAHAHACASALSIACTHSQNTDESISSIYLRKYTYTHGCLHAHMQARSHRHMCVWSRTAICGCTLFRKCLVMQISPHTQHACKSMGTCMCVHIRTYTDMGSQRSLHNAPIFCLLLKLAVNGARQCDCPICCGSFTPTYTDMGRYLQRQGQTYINIAHSGNMFRMHNF